ncbi:c-type cytochrome biogenesis protein CcmI [Vreelandella alkaliphila]|uniref:C-type cytochrome biogenesis protein CcmI n=1 Tax=Vreelandella alkaliphila TaxID=272774 RepID=A0A7C9P357_9GAMM|nr:c-type cytochrome biogenesis protein CcmI [Halomonas alkaliphila]NDL70250.1 c-type cytochrome biogenesis protein CcmI [Halomonas alkaliphila]
MTPLWIAIALLLLPALWLLVAPMRGSRVLRDQLHHFEANDTSAEQNVAIFRRRLASLEAARERGDIDDARFAEDRLELERSLLEDTAVQTKRPLKTATAGRIVVPLVMIAVVGASTFWYQQHGAEGDLTLYAIQQELRSDPDSSLEMYLERMEAEAERQPNNPNVWSALFPLYRETGQPDKADDALERLIAIEGRIPPLLAQLAQLRFFMAGRELTPDVQSLVDETLEQDPRQPTVLGMLGVYAFDNGDYEAAIDRWRRALANIEDSNTASSLREGIRVAQERLGITPEIADVDAAQGQGVRVTVSLDQTLVDNVEDGATVFITARDMEGELPPLAVVRGQVSELPMTVVLDDTAAMSPEAQISQVREVRLMVRVSPSGQATPQPGDLFGDLESVSVGPISEDDAATVIIDRIFE